MVSKQASEVNAPPIIKICTMAAARPRLGRKRAKVGTKLEQQDSWRAKSDGNMARAAVFIMTRRGAEYKTCSTQTLVALVACQ